MARDDAEQPAMVIGRTAHIMEFPSSPVCAPDRRLHFEAAASRHRVDGAGPSRRSRVALRGDLSGSIARRTGHVRDRARFDALGSPFWFPSFYVVGMVLARATRNPMDSLEQERVALLTLNATLDLTYRANAGGSYFNCCSWEGVECNPTTGRVTHLMLSDSRYYRFGFKTWYLNASLLLPFEELKSLDLSSNYLGGWIAPEEPNLLSSRLSKLEVLDLSGNSLDKSILSILDTIPSLRHLFLNGSNLSGTLHVNGGFSNLMELDISDNAIDAVATVEGNLSNLKELDISYNAVDAMASVEGIKNLSHLENLHLDGAHLKHVGTVVRALGALSSLRILSLQYNTVEGTLTTQGLCNLVKLEELDLSFNGITGGLPTCWRNMSSIRILNLEDNEFTDSNVSSPLTSLTSLEFLSISGKHFDITSSLGPLANHSRLKVLILDDTKLTIDTKVASLIPRFQLKVLSMSNSPSRGFELTSLGFLKHQYDLRILDLSSNDIPGPFPAWLLENNTKLEELFMANNLFMTFKVPSMTLFNLSTMDISNNNMRGELTTEFCANVPNLYHLNLSANRLEGNIPSELGSVKFLDVLDLSSNNFSGGLPIQLLDSPFLYLNVAYNKLQGEIGLSNHTMNPMSSFLRLDHNLFTGSLSFLSSPFDLRVLDVSNNIFIGKLPRLIANMSSLVALDLSKNHLDGLIPQELCNLGGLEYLDLSHNNFSGPLPSFFISQRVHHIHLNGNKLNGTLVHALSNSSLLVTLDLSENEFSGSIPYWLGNLSQLSILSLKGNSFYGTFPEQLCKLKSLSMIDLSENNLFGPLPNCLGPMNLSEDYTNKVTSTSNMGDLYTGWSPWSYVRTIKSHTELFYKEIIVEFEAPHTVGFTTKRRFDSYKGYTLLKMVGLVLSCNQFSGEIPSEIAILQEMLVLNLSHNKLTGRIPMSLSRLTKIESIDLSYNNLIGSIPEELTQLNSLEVFNVSYNNLSGAIPNKNQYGAFDESSYYGNHLLCGLPLSKKCSTTIDVNCSTTKSCATTKEDGFIDKETFYISFGVSYMMVGLVIPVVLFINPQWRHGWFHYVELVITTCQSLFITCYYFVQDGFRKLSRGQTF
ncbi:receptor-like protein 15 [Eucalyptus grandis]|uniref:receptor-like protein 15 n=1 Tax=Eucalyptus grandis TaxID=71139 RepID=UPI00192E76EB|nr:receptor-like protein 15 [Eucalyptus grandis]